MVVKQFDLIGGDSSGDNFKGIIDDVRFYTYAQTQAQVSWDYNRGAPIAYWSFDECSSATANDTAPKADRNSTRYDGTITPGGAPNTAVGTCTSGDSAHMWYDGATGKRNASLGFDGTDDYVVVTDNTSLSPAVVTISQWIYPTAAGSSGGDLATLWKGHIGSSTDQSYGFLWGDTQYVTFRIGGTASYDQLLSSEPLSLNQWTHVLGTYDGSGLRLYINGVLDDSKSTSITSLKDTSQNLFIGASYTTAPFKFFTGLIDETKIWNYPLTAQQVRDVYNEGAVHFGQ